MDAYSALQSAAALFGFWIVIYYLWRDFRYDAFREDIFSIRDEMFLCAAAGNIEFSNPAYTILRDRMNVWLRHGHDITLTRAVLLFVTHDQAESETRVQWERAIQNLPIETRNQMNSYRLRVAIFIFQHLVYCSFFRYLVLRPFLTGSNVHQLTETPVVASGVQKLESKTIEDDKRLVGHAVTV